MNNKEVKCLAQTVVDFIGCPQLMNSSLLSSSISLRIVGHRPIGTAYDYINNIVNSVITYLKVPYTIRFYSSMGGLTPDGWDGVTGQLINNQSDIGVGPFSITLQRYELMKPSAPLFYSSPVAILSGRITENTKSSNVFDIFQSITWISIILSVISMALIDTLIYSKDNTNYFKIKIILRKVHLYSSSLLSQSLKYFERICCFKHLMFIGMSLIAIHLMILFFKSNICQTFYLIPS